MVQNGAPVPEFVLRSEVEVRALAFHPQLDILYAGNGSGKLCVWSCVDRRPLQIQSLLEDGADIFTLAVCGSNYLFSQGKGGQLALWQLDAQGLPASTPAASLVTQQYNFCKAAVHSLSRNTELSTRSSVQKHSSPSSQVRSELQSVSVATLGHNATAIQLFAVECPQGSESGTCAFLHTTILEQPSEDKQHGMTMALQLFGPEQQQQQQQQQQQHESLRLAAGYEDGSVLVWDTHERAVLASLHLFSEPVMALAVGPSLAEVIASTATTAMALAHLGPGQTSLKLAKRLSLSQPGCDQLAVRADGRIVAAASWSGLVQIFHARKGTALATLQHHTAAVSSVAFDPGTQILAAGSRDGSISCWDIYK